MFEKLPYEEIKKMEKATFKVTNVAEDAVLELSEVSSKKGDAALESFSLVFNGSLEYFFPQNSYLLHHETFGDGEVFIVPVEKTEKNFVYEAVFNRVVSD